MELKGIEPTMASSLPERYQRYADPAAGQRQQYGVQPREIELYDEADPIVHVPDPYNVGRFVEVRRSSIQAVQPTPQRDLTPQPLFDPIAQRILATGVGVGAALWGAGKFLLGASALVSSVAGALPVVLALALLLFVARARSRGNTYNHNEFHVRQKWLGKTDIGIHNN